MKLNEKTVFVLGAGFTKAFVPHAPLLEDEYNGEGLLRKFSSFPQASAILYNELERKPKGKINLERLMARLQGQMPYDSEHGAADELNLLLSELKQTFSNRLNEAKDKEVYREVLLDFARLCIENKITCITFNYDDVFDEALWSFRKVTSETNEPYWHPDGGYGFFCRPSLLSIQEVLGLSMDITSMLLLKLHGSVNWRVRRGYPQPFSVDAIVHHTDWMEYKDKIDVRTIEIHLEKDPFIVPPLLTKEALINQPVLRLIWSHAYDSLKQAEQVVFVGYSFPITDIASSFLFSESISSKCMVRVINFEHTKTGQADIRKRYRNILPGIRYEYFDFEGALNWV